MVPAAHPPGGRKRGPGALRKGVCAQHAEWHTGGMQAAMPFVGPPEAGSMAGLCSGLCSPLCTTRHAGPSWRHQVDRSPYRQSPRHHLQGIMWLGG
jgi:hypothetical protein